MKKYLLLTASLAVLFTYCKDSPVGPVPLDNNPNDFPLSVLLNPMAGKVDAVTQASDKLSLIDIKAGPLTTTSEKLNSMVIHFGDGSKDSIYDANAPFPVDSTITIEHWYIRTDKLLSVSPCTTSITATTDLGNTADTAFIVRVLKKGTY